MKEAFRRLIPWIFGEMWIVLSLKNCGMKSNAKEIYYDLARVLSVNGVLSPLWPGDNWDDPVEGREEK